MVTYNPRVFEHKDIASAKSIILTNEGEVSTDVRWQTETPYLCEQLLSWCSVSHPAQVLDFGCGIGRMSRELLARTSASVWGVDISPTMRQQALAYVDSDHFTATSAVALDSAVNAGMRFDLALSVWVLQHCPDLQLEVKRLSQSLRPGGILFVVDMNHRAIPTLEAGWVDDGMNVKQTLLQHFQLVREAAFNAPHSPANLQHAAWMGLFQKRTESS